MLVMDRQCKIYIAEEDLPRLLYSTGKVIYIEISSKKRSLEQTLWIGTSFCLVISLVPVSWLSMIVIVYVKVIPPPPPPPPPVLSFCQ